MCSGLERVILPVQLLQPGVEVWVVVSDGAQVAFEVADVDGIEADLWDDVRNDILIVQALTIVVNSLISASVSCPPTR